MKTRKINIEEIEIQTSGCCSTPIESKEKKESCCEQPIDESSCCDKSETKEVNSEKTGCC